MISTRATRKHSLAHTRSSHNCRTKVTLAAHTGVTDDNRICDELIVLFRDEPEVNQRLVEICAIGKDQELVQEPPKKKKERPAPAAQPYRLYEERNRKYADLYE